MTIFSFSEQFSQYGRQQVKLTCLSSRVIHFFFLRMMVSVPHIQIIAGIIACYTYRLQTHRHGADRIFYSDPFLFIISNASYPKIKRPLYMGKNIFPVLSLSIQVYILNKFTNRSSCIIKKKNGNQIIYILYACS